MRRIQAGEKKDNDKRGGRETRAVAFRAAWQRGVLPLSGIVGRPPKGLAIDKGENLCPECVIHALAQVPVGRPEASHAAPFLLFTKHQLTPKTLTCIGHFNLGGPHPTEKARKKQLLSHMH